MKAFYKVGIEEDNIVDCVERMQDSVERSLTPVLTSIIIDGLLLENVSLSTSPTRVDHKLGRKPRGYHVVRRNANSVVFDLPEIREDLFLNLQASANVTVSLWIF